MPVSDLSDVLRSIRVRYPTPLGDRHPAFLVEAARATGAKLLRKESGSHVTLPTGVGVSTDILVFSNGAECFDVLRDSEGAGEVVWQARGAIAGEYVDVGNAAPPPPQGDLADRVGWLEERFDRLVEYLRGVE